MKKCLSPLLIIALFYSFVFANDSETILKLGDTFFRDSLHTMALSQYEKYVSSSPNPTKLPRVFYRIGSIYKNLSSDAEALDWYGRLMQRFPTDPLVKLAHFESGAVYEKRKQWFEAGEEYYNVWHVFGTSAEAEEALFRAADCYGNGGDFQRSVELYRLYLSRFGQNRRAGEAAANAVDLQIKNKDYSAAQELLTQARSLSLSDEWRSEMNYLEAVAVFATHNTAEAEKLLQSAVDGKKEFRSQGDALALYSELLAAREEYKKAWSKYSQFLQYRNDSLTYSEKMFWADVAYFSNAYDSCTALYLSAMKDSSVNEAVVQYNLARNYDASGDFHSALKALRKVGKSDSLALSQTALLKISELYYKNGIYANSVQEYRKYLAGSGPKSDMALYRIGRIYQEKLSAPEMALREYDKLLKWYAGSPFVAKASLAMAEIYESREKYEEAFRTYRYLATLEGETSLGRKARERSEYLDKFRIPHAISAIADLTELSLNDKFTPQERRLKGAEIYRNYLKDRFRAIELLTPLIETELPDSLKGQVLMALAINWKELSDQFREEKKDSESSYAVNQAVSYYTKLLEDQSQNRWHNEARFQLVALSGDGIKAYESFVESYPMSPFSGKAYMIIAAHYRETNKSLQDSRKAASAYRRAYESGDLDLTQNALIGAIQLYLNISELDTAGQLLNVYRSEYQDKLKGEEYSWLQARYSHIGGDEESARPLYLYIVDNFPQGAHTVHARLYLADVELKMGKTAKAFNNYTLVSSLLPDGTLKGHALVGRVDALIRQGRPLDAQTLIAETAGVPWTNPEQKSMLAYLSGKAYEIAGDPYGALKQFTLSLKNPNFSKKRTALREAASLNYTLREYAASAELYSVLRGSHDDSTYYEMRYITASILAGRGSSVAKEYKSFKSGAGKAQPEKMLEIYFAEGLHFYRVKEYGKAEKRFSFVAKKGGRSDLVDDAVYYSALILYDEKKRDDALVAMNAFVDRYSESDLVSSALFTMAMIYHQSERLPEAGKQYEEVVARAEEDAELRFRALVNGAVIWQKLSAWESAAKMSEAVLNEFGSRVDSSSYALKTGFAYLKANRVKRALSYFKLAEKKPNPIDKPEISYWIAMSNLRLGQDEQALELFLQISYLYGNSGKWGVTADFEAARIYEQRGEFAKASSLYRKIVRIEGEASPIGNDAKERIAALETLMEEF